MTTLAPPPYEGTALAEEPLAYDISNLSAKEKKELLDSASIGSATTEFDDPHAATGFNPTKTFHINAVGIRLFRLPCPSSELEIPIYDSNGSLAYMHTRAKKSSGNAVLSAADGRGDLVASTYRWGPGRDPQIAMLKRSDGQNEIKVDGKWTSRAQTFTDPATPVTFQWRYRREKVPLSSGKVKGSARVVLEVQGGEKNHVRRVAQLTRTEETRSPGSGSCAAGNGGELEVDEMAARGLGISEELVVATCMMMLKKEVDRRRAQQMMMMSAAISGAASGI